MTQGARGDGGHLARERELKAMLQASTRGLDDCGSASHGRYVSGCRCAACRNANTQYERGRTRRKLYRKPSGFVDAQPVRERIAKLLSLGYSLREIVRLSGVGRTTINSIVAGHWRTGRPVARCRRETKDAIFSIKGQRRLTAGQMVDAAQMRNDLERWRSAGMSVARISRLSGIDRQVIDRVLAGQDRVLARTLHAHMSARPALDAEAGTGMPDYLDILGV